MGDSGSRVRLTRMSLRVGAIALLVLAVVVEATPQSTGVPGAEWKQLASPEAAGWSAKNLGKIRDYVGETGSTSAPSGSRPPSKTAALKAAALHLNL